MKITQDHSLPVERASSRPTGALQALADRSPQVSRVARLQRAADGAADRSPVQRVVRFVQQTGEKTTPDQATLRRWLSGEVIQVAEGSPEDKAIANMIAAGETHEFPWAYGQSAFMATLRTYLRHRRNGPYGYGWQALDPEGECHLVVYAEDEAEPVGYARFHMQDIAEMAPPSTDEPYSREHVLARAGRVAHLTHLYNTTLMRDGPADIHSGFGREMLKLCEEKARSLGARLMYLEAASAQVRTDPMTNEKQPQDSTGFYKHLGYAIDPIAAAHNWGLAMAEAVSFRLGAEDQIPYVQRRLATLLQGMLSKSL